VVAHVYNPSYMRGRGRRISVYSWPQAKTGELIQKITKAKEDIFKKIAFIKISFKDKKKKPS
jgi:hypothetical protein